MKLNPFNKKSNAYFSKVKADYDKLDREHKALQAQLREAEADAEEKGRHYEELAQAGSIYSSSPSQKRTSFAASEARNRVGAIRGDIEQLRSHLAPLMRIALAPSQYAEARKSLDDLRKQDRELSADLAKTESLIAKLNRRTADVEARITTEMKSATATMLDAEDEFNVPETLTKLEVELRISQTSLAELQSKRTALAAVIGELPKAIREAERIFVATRAVMAEIELYEQLMPVMNLVARASVSRHQDSYSHNQRRFEIEIPEDLIASAEAQLVEELAAA